MIFNFFPFCSPFEVPHFYQNLVVFLSVALILMLVEPWLRRGSVREVDDKFFANWGL